MTDTNDISVTETAPAVKRTRKPMTTPSKAQLTASVAYFQTALGALLAGPALAAEDLKEELQAVLDKAPSLAPVSAAAEAE